MSNRIAVHAARLEVDRQLEAWHNEKATTPEVFGRWRRLMAAAEKLKLLRAQEELPLARLDSGSRPPGS